MRRAGAGAGQLRARLKLVLLAYGLRTLGALVVGWPLAQSLARVNVLALPHRDRELFAPGARTLLQLLAESSGALLPWLRLRWPLGILIIVVGAMASSVILCALAAPMGTREATCLRRAAIAMPTQVVIVLTGWLVFGAVLFAANLGFSLVPAIVYPFVGEKGADIALIVLVFAVGFSGLVTFAVVDLARASNAQAQSGLRESIAAALGCLSGRFRACIVGALSYAILAMAVPALVEVSLPPALTLTPGKLILTAVVHQLTVIGLCALHVAWWAYVIKLVQVPARQEDAYR